MKIPTWLKEYNGWPLIADIKKRLKAVEAAGGGVSVYSGGFTLNQLGTETTGATYANGGIYSTNFLLDDPGDYCFILVPVPKKIKLVHFQFRNDDNEQVHSWGTCDYVSGIGSCTYQQRNGDGSYSQYYSQGGPIGYVMSYGSGWYFGGDSKKLTDTHFPIACGKYSSGAAISGTFYAIA